MAQRYLGLLDMLNGGGAGQAGPEFEGGLFSGLLNALGIKPMGSRMNDAGPPPPSPDNYRPAAAAGSPPPGMVPPVQTSPVIAGGMTYDDIMAALGSPVVPQAMPTAYPSLPEIAAMMEAQRKERAARLYGLGGGL